MQIKIFRFRYDINFTLGKLFLFDKEKLIYECFTLEPKGPQTTKSNQNQLIPKGKYDLQIVFSTKFQKFLPLIFNDEVSKNRRILIHSGNSFNDTKGCILVGEKLSSKQNQILNSKIAIDKILNFIKNQQNYLFLY